MNGGCTGILSGSIHHFGHIPWHRGKFSLDTPISMLFLAEIAAMMVKKKRIKMVFSWSNPLKLTYCCFNPMFHASIHRSLLDKVSRCLNLTGKNPGFAMCSRSDHGNKRWVPPSHLRQRILAGRWQATGRHLAQTAIAIADPWMSVDLYRCVWISGYLSIDRSICLSFFVSIYLSIDLWQKLRIYRCCMDM